jgi:serine/threonine protein kinase
VYKGQATSAAAQELLKDLLASNLLRTEDFEALPPMVRQRLNGMSDPNRLLDQLLMSNLLTGYQAGRIRARKPQWLILGNYRVLDRLGGGSLGVVFKADHLITRQLAAIKVLVPNRRKKDSPLVALFAERQAVAQVQHPNIVRALDVGEARSDDPDCPIVYYYVMEHVSGVDLEQKIRQGKPFGVAQACDIAFQVASALAAAHAHGLVHRDLKPSNVIWTEGGQVKLLDFGLVRSFNAALGNSCVVPSRPEFMAPELIDKSKPADIRADLYGLGAILFWCLTGAAPFRAKGSMEEILAERQTQGLPDLMDYGVEAPESLLVLLARLLALRPEDRPADPEAVMSELAPFRSEGAEDALAPDLLPVTQTVRPGGTVLVVDSKTDSRAACVAALDGAGLLVDEADSVKAGLESTLAGRHQVLLVAAELPDARGLDLLRYLRKNPPRPNLKILMICASATTEANAELLAAGADDCLARPIDADIIKASVQSALALKQEQDRGDSALEAQHRLEAASPAPMQTSGRKPPPSRLLRSLAKLFRR